MPRVVKSTVVVSGLLALFGCETSDLKSDDVSHALYANALHFVDALGDAIVLPPRPEHSEFAVFEHENIGETVSTVMAAIKKPAKSAVAGSERSLGLIPFFSQTEIGRAYAADPENRVIVFGFPRETCPYSLSLQGVDPASALGRAFAQCLRDLPRTPVSEGCGCRAEAVEKQLLVDPDILEHDEKIPFSMISIDAAGIEPGPDLRRGFAFADETAGRNMPLDLTDPSGDAFCKGKFSVEARGLLRIELECPDHGGSYEGLSGLIGYNHGRSYGFGVIESAYDAKNEADRHMIVWFGYDEPELTELETKTADFMEEWRAAALGDETMEAMAAYRIGDHAKARNLLHAVADKPNSRAQINLARFLRDGIGGDTDPVEAYARYSMATLAGIEGGYGLRALVERNAMAADMGQRQILAAERRVIGWIHRHIGRIAVDTAVERAMEQLYLADPPKRIEAATTLARLGPASVSAVSTLEARVKDDARWIPRSHYARALAAIGSKAAPALARLLLDQSTLAREGNFNAHQAAKALASLGPAARGVLPDLIEALRDDYEGIDRASDNVGYLFVEQVMHIKAPVLAALGAIGHGEDEVLASVLDHLADEPLPAVRLLIAEWLYANYHRTDQALVIVGDGLHDKDSSVVEQAVEIAANMGTDAAPLTDRLQDLRRHRSPRVRQAAENALVMISRSPR